MELSKPQEEEIRLLLDNYWASYLKGNLDNWASLLHEEFCTIGTTQEEVWESPA